MYVDTCVYHILERVHVRVCVHAFVFALCMYIYLDSTKPAELSLVAQLVEYLPRTQCVVVLNPTQGRNHNHCRYLYICALFCLSCTCEGITLSDDIIVMS